MSFNLYNGIPVLVFQVVEIKCSLPISASSPTERHSACPALAIFPMHARARLVSMLPPVSSLPLQNVFHGNLGTASSPPRALGGFKKFSPRSETASPPRAVGGFKQFHSSPRSAFSPHSTDTPLGRTSVMIDARDIPICVCCALCILQSSPQHLSSSPRNDKKKEVKQAR